MLPGDQAALVLILDAVDERLQPLLFQVNIFQEPDLPGLRLAVVQQLQVVVKVGCGNLP